MKNSELDRVYSLIMQAYAIAQQHSVGRLLTVMDAVFSDPIQRKAIKDMVKQSMYNYSIEGDVRANLSNIFDDAIKSSWGKDEIHPTPHWYVKKEKRSLPVLLEPIGTIDPEDLTTL